jgi:primosomal protein N' (replication factor Y)
MFYYEVAILSIAIDQTFTYQSNQKISDLTLVTVPFQNRIKKAYIINETNKPNYNCVDISTIEEYYLPKEYFKIAMFIKSYYFCSICESLALFTPFKTEQKTYHEKINHEKIELSSAQNKALEFVKTNQLSLIFGDTGSGKTEIYIKRFQEIIDQNKTIIFLLPEISLTPQMINRVTNIFGDHVATWHSKLTKKKKEQTLENIYNGKIKIVVGARSSLFLPMKNLGLIVVDEEHDDSYKSMQKPKYHAKDLSLYFGKVLDIPVILGSATPSLNSYEKIPHYRLKGTFFDTKKEYFFDTNEVALNQNILDTISNTLKEKNQVIIFLPTRANFKHLVCDKCFKSVQCPFCTVSVSLHRSQRFLKCHYCNFTQKIPEICPSCGEGILLNRRIGTAEITENLKEYFSEYKIEKFDRDEIKSETKLKKTLKDFNDNKIDILVGTQMLSKGHDYHNVKLVIILEIDNILHIPDFKARENAMSLLTQIAGRSGRKTTGKIVIQSQNEKFFNQYLNDYEQFIKDELKYRIGLYPPYKRLIKINFSHKVANRAFESMNQMVGNLRMFDYLEIIGFGEANIFKIANKYRYYILIRFENINQTIKAINTAKTEFCDIDMDPISFG